MQSRIVGSDRIASRRVELGQREGIGRNSSLNLLDGPADQSNMPSVPGVDRKSVV